MKLSKFYFNRARVFIVLLGVCMLVYFVFWLISLIKSS